MYLVYILRATSDLRVFNSYCSISLGSFFFILKFILKVMEEAEDLKFELLEAEYSSFMLLVTS